MKKMKRGFTLIELLIVIIIIGILAVIVVGLVATNARDRAMDAGTKADMREIQTALELYNVENSDYPDATEFLALRVSGDVDLGIYDDGYTPGDCYELKIRLENTSDSGPNVNDVGDYVLVCKQ